MEVTNQNFNEALEKVKENLKEAEFVSFDGEFTGLGFGKSSFDKYNDLDTPESRYQKAKNVVTEYGLIQFGISIFRFCSKKKQYYSSTFCFFLAGDANGSYRYDSSSMSFLAENKFDFNKLFTEGLPFLSLSNEVNAREKRVNKLSENKYPASPIAVKDENSKKFLKDANEKISNLNSSNVTCTFTFSTMTSFHRKILYNNVAPKFPNIKYRSIKNRDIEFTYFETEMSKLSKEDDEWEAEMNAKIGFCHVIKAILEAEVPVVGHNIFLDLLHIVDKFLAPLPNTLEEFKSLVQNNMPVIYDTKLIAKDPPFSANIVNTALGVLYDELISHYNPPICNIEKDCLSYNIVSDGQAHDAGYDSYMTGICFASMIKHLDGANWKKVKSPLNSKHLVQYSNKMNLMCSYDIPFINIMQAEVIPDRSSIYCVDCPSTWSHLDVRRIFGKLKSYKTVWVSDIFMYVIPQDPDDLDQSEVILEGIRALCPSDVFVSMYNAREAQASNDNAKNPTNQVISDNKATVKEKITRPASINLKRKSKNLDGSSEEFLATGVKILKRLKSVGSEQLSNMSLDSPNVEDVGLEVNSIKDLKCKKKTDEFEVPDNW